jgi:hypothetical protein
VAAGERRAGQVLPRQRLSVERLRTVLSTPPDRLRLAGAVLAAVVLLFGAVTAWQVDNRAQAADQVVTHSEPLSQDAAEIYRSLADADTTAASGFLQAGDEPAAVRQRYEDDLTTAARLLAQAAARTTASDDAQHWVSELNQQLPRYAGLVETARANNRQGLPLGGAYLRYASAQMQNTLLPDAQKLVDAESKRMDGDYADGQATAWGALLLGLLALGALGWYQVKLFRRTNRVFNVGLLGATAAVVVALLWLQIGDSLAASSLADSSSRAAQPLRTLDQARIQSLKAHAAENLDLVARGSTDTYTTQWKDVTTQLAGPAGSSGPIGGTLLQAQRQAPGSAEPAVAAAEKQYTAWAAKHQAAATANQAGDYDTALKDTVGTSGETADTDFAAMDQQLAKAATAEQAEFKQAADGVSGELDVLAAGAAVLSLVAAVGVVRGIGRRVAEYR